MQELGQLAETYQTSLQQMVLAQSPPPEETEVLVASLDRANVLLRESGVKKDRPVERPQEVTQTTVSNYKLGRS